MPFTGFPDPDTTFFFRLAENQSREWFQVHKAEHTRDWVQPMTALLEEVRPLVQPAFEGRRLSAPKIYRINRDVRFSADKSPYKTRIGGYLQLAGESEWPPAVVYVQFGIESFVGGGHYRLDTPQLARFRAAVAAPGSGERLAGLIEALERRGFTVASLDSLKRVPKGFDPEHRRANLLKWKSLVVHFPSPPRETVASAEFVEWLAAHARTAAPLITWLADSTG